MSDSDSDNGPSWSVMGDSTCLDPKTNPDAIWPYCPSFPAAIIFTILFAVAMMTHITQAAVNRKRFCWVIIMAAIWETTGFALRAAGTQYQRSLGLLMFQQLLILLSPLWVNAFVYMTFGRLVHYFVPEKKLMGIRATRLAMTFVWLDILSFLIQAAGGSMASGDGRDIDRTNLGLKVYMGGMGLQQAFIVFFVVLLINFHRRMAAGLSEPRLERWQPLVYLSYAAVSLITLRIIFRMAEFAGGIESSIAKMESLMYVFDALPMWVCIVMYCVYHPARTFKGEAGEFPKLTRKEKKEMKMMKKQEKRAAKEMKKFKGAQGMMYDVEMGVARA